MAGNFETAMKAALQGPEKKKLKIFDHEFNVKPVEVSQQDKQTTVIGQISHHLSFRKDDQVFYRIVKEDNEVKDIKVEISRGGAAPFVAPLISGLAALKGVSIPPDKIEAVGQQLGKAIEGKWEDTAQFLIANIALRVDADKPATKADKPATKKDSLPFGLKTKLPFKTKAATKQKK